MLIHIVSFRYKAVTAETARQDHRDELKALASQRDVVDLKVGKDVVGSPRLYDTGLVITFRDRAGLDNYQKDPQHVPVAQLGVSLCDHIVAVDFDA